jgi:hypothetical protein
MAQWTAFVRLYGVIEDGMQQGTRHFAGSPRFTAAGQARRSILTNTTIERTKQ